MCGRVAATATDDILGAFDLKSIGGEWTRNISADLITFA